MATTLKFKPYAFIAIAVWSCTDSGPSKRQLTGGSNSSKCLTLSQTSKSKNYSLAGNSWQSNISSLFQNNCGSCHPGTQTTDYTVYANVTGNISNIVNRIKDGTMPPSGALAQADQDAIQAWVTAGTPQADSSSNPGPSSNAGCN